MEKEEKLQKLFALAKELELTPDDIIKGVKGYNSISESCLSKIVETEIVPSCQKKKVGMFYYAEDKSFSEELIPNKNVSGVVGYVDESGEHGLIVLLHQLELQWLNQRLSVGLSDVLSGKENTLLILDFAGKQGLMAEAVEYCTEYDYDGVKIGEAFLPSIDELKRLYENKQLINDKLALTKGVDLFNNKYYWSSSENSYNYAWRLCFGNGRVDYDDKVGIAYVCPVVAF